MKELRPVHAPNRTAEQLEARIKSAFRRHIYAPLLDELEAKYWRLKNAADDESPLLAALHSGRVTYSKADGVFRGSFDAAVSKELKLLGARWDRPLKAWRLAESDLPRAVRAAVSTANARFDETLKALDERLRQILPEEIAGNNIFAEIFDKGAATVDNNLRKTLDNITVLPELSPAERRQLAEEWGENLSLYIRDFADSEILRLRRQIAKNVMSGNRVESVMRTIQASYGVTASKARFLADQETRLMTVALKKQRYTSAGVPEYRWACVHNPHDKSPKEHTLGNVRWSHSQLNGKIFRWDDPPISTPPGETQRRNHPGQDFNCFPGSTPVAHLNGVRKLYRRWYPGPLAFVVMDEGTHLDATPNHPVLTSNGMKALHSLQVGDYVVKAALQGVHAVEVDVENTQPTIQEIFCLGSIVGDVFSAEGHAAQFHGDGAANEIDVVSVDCGLVAEIDAVFAKEFTKRVLSVSDQVAIGLPLACARDLSAMVSGLGLTPDSVMGRFGQLLALLCGKSGHSEEICFGAATGLYAALTDMATYHLAAHAVFFGEGQLTSPGDIFSGDTLRKLYAVWCRATDPAESIDSASAETLAHDIGVAFQTPSDFQERHPLLKHFSRVVDKGFGVGAGHYVYNLETVGGWYVAHGVTVGNCRCAAIPVVRRFAE